MFDTMVHFVGMGIIIVSIIWSAYCLITYLIRRFSPAGFPARVPVRGTPRSVDPSQAGSAIRPEVWSNTSGSKSIKWSSMRKPLKPRWE